MRSNEVLPRLDISALPLDSASHYTGSDFAGVPATLEEIREVIPAYISGKTQDQHQARGAFDFLEVVHESRQPGLSAEQEKKIFQYYSYCRWQAWNLREQLKSSSEDREAIIAELIRYWSVIQLFETYIILTDLAMVAHVAKGLGLQGQLMDDYSSYGNEVLLRAMRGFDFRRGHRFSTLAMWSLLRRAPQELQRDQQRSRFTRGSVGELLEQLGSADENAVYSGDSAVVIERLWELLDKLHDGHRMVVILYHNLGETEKRAKSFTEIAKREGVTRTAIGFRYERALKKLRSMIEEDPERYEVVRSFFLED